MLFIPANTLVSAIDFGRKTDIPKVTRTVVVRRY